MRQRIISRLADALIVMDSRLVIRVENMVTTSNLEVLEVDLDGTTSNYLQLPLLVLIYFLPFPSSEYFNTIKRLCRKLLYMYLGIQLEFLFVDFKETYMYRYEKSKAGIPSGK